MKGTHPCAAAPTLEELHRLVHHALCRLDNLEPDQTPLMKSVVRKARKPCGLFYQVQGPRLMKSYAIWVGDENRVLFYNSAGERVKVLTLSESPDPVGIAA